MAAPPPAPGAPFHLGVPTLVPGAPPASTLQQLHNAAHAQHLAVHHHYPAHNEFGGSAIAPGAEGGITGAGSKGEGAGTVYAETRSVSWRLVWLPLRFRRKGGVFVVLGEFEGSDRTSSKNG